MLHLRKRGKIWHIRGTVKVGKKTLHVTEHSTGTTERSIAETYSAHFHAEKQRELVTAKPGDKNAESAMFERFARDRLRGEWFRETARLTRYVERVLSKRGPRPWPDPIMYDDQNWQATFERVTGRRPAPGMGIKIDWGETPPRGSTGMFKGHREPQQINLISQLRHREQTEGEKQ